MNTIENLVFEGGGVKGIAYAGAIEALQEKNVLKNVKRVAGTSAGAITAALVSLNYDAEEITKVVNATNFNDFEDHWNPLRIPTHYGLYKGDFLLGFIQSFIEKKAGGKEATFEDFKNLGCKDLRVFSSDLNMQEAREFSFEKTPKTIVAEAIRASMSIPLFFEAWRFKDNIPDDHIYVDGGLTYNYPITAFDAEGINEKTIGFHFGDFGNPATNNGLKYNHLAKYVKEAFGMLLNSQKINFDKDPTEKKRTVNINDFGISATEFNLTKDQKDKLYNSGKSTTESFLNDWMSKI